MEEGNALLKDAIAVRLWMKFHAGTQGVRSRYYTAQTDQMLRWGMKEQA